MDSIKHTHTWLSCAKQNPISSVGPRTRSSTSRHRPARQVSLACHAIAHGCRVHEIKGGIFDLCTSNCQSINHIGSTHPPLPPVNPDKAPRSFSASLLMIFFLPIPGLPTTAAAALARVPVTVTTAPGLASMCGGGRRQKRRARLAVIFTAYFFSPIYGSGYHPSSTHF